MSGNLDGFWFPLINPNTLQTISYMWPVEVIIRALDLAEMIDVEFVVNGADLSGVDTSKIVYEDGPIPNETRGSIKIHNGSEWVDISPALLFALISTGGQIQANWTETNASLSSFIRNRPSDVTKETYWSKLNRILVGDAVWEALEEQEITIDSGEATPDFGAGIDFLINADENFQLMNPQNKQVGQRGTIRVVQDSSGSRLITFDTDYDFINKTPFTLSTSADFDDEISYRVVTGGRVRLSIDKNWGV